MDRARELAERGRFTAAPNPLVGVVITRGGEVVGEGWHARAGGDHAEIVALKQSGPSAQDGTLYITLEPCNHYGRTPPCTDAIIGAGIAKVVVGHLDPNPKMQGKSVALLREVGVQVEVLEDSSFELQNEQFNHYMRTGLPFVNLKFATTLDGKIATSNGDSKWVTGEASRRTAHMLRAEAGAVLVGAGTMRADDPSLTARDLPDTPPSITRCVLDPKLTMKPESRLARSAGESPVILFCDRHTLDGREQRLVDLGVEVIGLEPSSSGALDVRDVLDALARRGVRGLLVEGGGETAAHFVRSGLANKLTVFYAPKFVGGSGVPMLGDLGLTRIQDAPRFSLADVQVFGNDLALTLYPQSGGE